MGGLQGEVQLPILSFTMVMTSKFYVVTQVYNLIENKNINENISKWLPAFQYQLVLVITALQEKSNKLN